MCQKGFFMSKFLKPLTIKYLGSIKKIRKRKEAIVFFFSSTSDDDCYGNHNNNKKETWIEPEEYTETDIY